MSQRTRQQPDVVSVQQDFLRITRLTSQGDVRM